MCGMREGGGISRPFISGRYTDPLSRGVPGQLALAPGCDVSYPQLLGDF